MKFTTLVKTLCVVLLLATPFVAKAQTFAPDNSLLLVPAKDANGTPVLALITPEGRDYTVLPQSQGAVIGAWSPDSKKILFVNSNRVLSLYRLKEQRTQVMANNVEAPLTWREDSIAFAAISVVEEKTGTVRELSRFDREGHIMGRIPLNDLTLDPRYPFYWISQTDEVAIFARNPKGTNCYVTDADQLRRVSTSDDLHGLGSIGGGKSLIWARRGENLHYILMTLYRYVTQISTVERLVFPERLPLLNPNPRTAPEALKSVVFSNDATRILVTAVVKTGGKPALNLFSLKGDGTEMHLLHRFTTTWDRVPPFPAQFSADGKLVAWMDAGQLFVCNTEGTNKTKLPLPN